MFKRSFKQKLKICYHFFGGCGGRLALLFLEAMDPEKYPDITVHVANTDADTLEKFFGDADNPAIVKWDAATRLKITLMGEDVTDGDGAGANYEIGLRAARSERTYAEFRRIIDGSAMNFMYAGVGKGTGGPALVVASQICRELALGIEPHRQKINIGHVVLPHGGEKGLGVNADRAYREIIENIPTVAIHNSKLKDYLAAHAGQNERSFSTDDLNAVVNKLALNPIMRATNEFAFFVGERNLDKADYRSHLQMGNQKYIGEAEFAPAQSGTITPEEIVKDLLGNKFQELDIVYKATSLVLLCIGWDDPEKLDKVSELIWHEIRKHNGERTTPPRILTGIRLKGVDPEEPRRVILSAIAEWQPALHRETDARVSKKPANVPVINRPGMRMEVNLKVEGKERQQSIYLPTRIAAKYVALSKRKDASEQEWLELQREILEATTRDGAPLIIDIPRGFSESGGRVVTH